MILLCLIARALFLAIIFVPTRDEFWYALWIDQFPNVFKLLVVVYVCKYKLHIYYLANGQRARPWVHWLIFATEVLCVVLPSTRSLWVCSTLGKTDFNIA